MPHFRALLLALGAASVAGNDLLKAIAANNPSQLNMAIKSTHPKKLNELDEAGMTPLMVAASQGKHKCIKPLLKAGADVTIADKDGYTVMHVAADNGHERVVQALITHGLDPKEVHADGLAPMHRAVAKGHTDTVKSLLNAEVPFDQPTGDGRLPMDLALNLATKEVLEKFSRATKKTEL